MEAKQLFRDGVRWRVGNGRSIQILDQPWLLDKENPCITSSVDPLQGNTVDSLLCMDRVDWDKEVILDVLNARDQKCVLEIPLSDSGQEDQLFWRFENSGIYSVKSAYNFLQSRKGDWNVADNDKIWQTLWSIKAPPKSLNLVWRALTGTLPTLSQLQSKRVQVQSMCPTCQMEVESIVHCLVSCQYARQCWSILLPGLQVMEGTSFYTWLSSVFDTVEKGKFAVIVSLCWSLWKTRNDLVWNQKHITCYRTVAAARQYLAQWNVTQNRNFTTPLQPQVEGDGAIVWVKPQANKVKISVDAAVFEDRGGVGFGLVARNAEGILIEAKALFHASLVSPVEAEAMAFKEALSWMDRRG